MDPDDIETENSDTESCDDMEYDPEDIRDELELPPKAMIDDSLIVLRTEVAKYIGTIIIGIEENMFYFINKNFPDEVNLLVTPNEAVYDIIRTMNEDYFNKLYHSENHTVLNSMCGIRNHNALCLMELIAQATFKLHLKIDRVELDAMNVDEYVASVSRQINWFSTDIGLTQMLMHECDESHDRIFISQDPPLKMFTFDVKFNFDDTNEE
jgi:hypothetical protein